MLSPIQFYEYDDRIEIQNPGGLYGKVSPDNFPNVSDYRNTFIAEAMKVLGYVNRFSRGGSIEFRRSWKKTVMGRPFLIFLCLQLFE